jgi:(p)ppGpp synthase/HD superfamily hydrolase
MLREKALTLALCAHAGQFDKAGAPYIEHPLVVAANFFDDDSRYIVSLLHDVVEDTNVTLEALIEYGFPDEIVNAIDAITKRSDESYDEYLSRIKANTIARDVKMADVKHNSDLSRLKIVEAKDYTRVKKYNKALEFLRKY